MDDAASSAGGMDWDGQVARVDDLCDSAPSLCVGETTRLIKLARTENRDDVEARLLYIRGFAYHLLSDDVRALASMTRALELAVAHGDRAWEGRILQGLAAAHNGFGDNSSAVDLLGQSLAVRRELDDTAGLATVLNNLADTYLSMRQFPDKARELLLEALTLWSRVDRPDGTCATLTNLAALDVQESERLAVTEPARSTAHAASAVDWALRGTAAAGADTNPRISIEAELTLARALMACARLDEAKLTLDALAPRLDTIGVTYLTIRYLGARGQLERLAGNPLAAIRQLTAGLELTRETARRLERTALLAELVLVHEDAGSYREALEAHRAFHAAVLEQRDEAAERRANVVNARLEVTRANDATNVARKRTMQLETINASLAHDAVHDPLTGLVNRRGFDTALAARLRDDIRLACVVLDLDRFKSVNDHHSHAVGDEVLRRVARLMDAAIHVGDVSARIGGEEFVLLLVNTTAARARDVCDRLRAQIAEHAWHEVAPGLSVTTSVGGTMLIPGETGAELMARADAELYLAKAAGRNLVRFSGTDEPTDERTEIVRVHRSHA